MSKRRPTITELACRRMSPLDELIARGEPECDANDEQRERLAELIQQVPRIERELVLLAMDGKSHREMAEVTGLSKPGVLSRLRRAIARLRYLAARPEVNEMLMASMLRSYGFGDDDIAIMIVYLDTTCMSETARRLGVRRWQVRYLLTERAPKLLAAHHELTPYREALEYVTRAGLRFATAKEPTDNP